MENCGIQLGLINIGLWHGGGLKAQQRKAGQLGKKVERQFERIQDHHFLVYKAAD